MSKLILRNSLILYTKLLVQALISLYTTRIILKALGVVDFGIYNLLGSTVAMFSFFRAALASSTSRFLLFSEGERDKVNKTKIFNISLQLHVILAIFLVIILEIGFHFFFQVVFKIQPDRILVAKQVSHMIVIIAGIYVLTAPFEAILNSHENMFYFSLIDILKSFAVFIVSVYIDITKNDKLFFYSIAMLIITLLVLLAYGIYCFINYRECKLNRMQRTDLPLVKEIFSYSGYELLGYSSGIISLYSTSILINSFFGTIMNAAQGIAIQISGQITAFSNTMLKAVNPVIVKSKGARDHVSFEKITLRSGKFAFLILAIFSIPFLIKTKYILTTWLVNVPELAVLFCQFQVLKNLLEQFTVSYGIAIGANGRIRNYTILNTINNLFPIPIIYLLFELGMPPYSMYIVLILFFSILNFLINIYFSRSLLGFNYKEMVKNICFPSIFIFSIVFFLSLILSNFLQESITSLAVICLFSSSLLTYLAYLFLLEIDEKRMLFKLFKNILEIVKK